MTLKSKYRTLNDIQELNWTSQRRAKLVSQKMINQ